MKILLPTDFSQNARTAIEYAISMFRYDNVKYILLNSYIDRYTTADMLISIRDLMKKDSENGLKQEAEFLLENSPEDSLDIETRSVFGGLDHIIKGLIKSEGIDLVVMGTKGATGLKSVFVGSNTEKVVGKVKIPVLVIPEDTKFMPPARIALATDEKEFSDQFEFSSLKELVMQFDAEFFIVNILTGGKDQDASCKIKLHRTFQGIPHTFHHLKHSDVIAGLNQFVEENRIDILAMVGHRHKFLERLFIKSTTKEMSMFTNVPLLIMHEK